MSLLDQLMSDDTATSFLANLKDSQKTKTNNSNNVWFRYRNLDYGNSCTLRFLPASEENISGPFWRPRKIIRLKFADPRNVGQDVNIAIPVMQMWTGGRTQDDPVLGQVTRLYEEASALDKKGESEKSKQVRAKASYHYIKGESIAQGFVINPGFLENDPPENPIRVFDLNKQIVKVIQAKLDTENPELKLDYWPCHGKFGYNFVIKKTRTGDGKFPKYDDGTGFSNKTTPLSELHKAAVDKYGLWDLNQFLPTRPSESEYKLLAYIVQQSIAGNRIWDPDWEDELSAVKVYRSTREGEQGDDMDTGFREQVREQINRGAGSANNMTDTADILSSLSRTGSRTESESTEEVVVEDESQDYSGQSEVQSIVDTIRRRQTKTATLND